MAVSLRAALGVALPLAAAVGSCVLALAFVTPGVDLSSMARGVVGPASWPKTMLLCASAAAALLAFGRLVELFAPHSSQAPVAGVEEEYHEGRSLGAIALLLGYGLAIPLVGFAWATPVFLAGWLLLGGLRRPLLVGLTSILGALGILYFFVKVSLMPLDRGKGVFEQATVALYQLLGIY
jgi:putative tricarboxylic transport membrane protein